MVSACVASRKLSNKHAPKNDKESLSLFSVTSLLTNSDRKYGSFKDEKARVKTQYFDNYHWYFYQYFWWPVSILIFDSTHEKNASCAETTSTRMVVLILRFYQRLANQIPGYLL